MVQTLIGTKIEQTQGFLSDGTRIPVTVIAMPKASIIQVKTMEKDGYSAVQIGVGIKKKPTKALSGHVQKAKLSHAPKTLREVKLTDEDQEVTLGAAILATEVFKTGDIIKVSGVGKGKGFQGGVKRHGFRGGPRTHGQSDRERAPGSIGQTTTPGRVYKGKRMAGHMGTGQVTVANLVVVSVDEEKMLVKGLVPGVLNSTVLIEKTGELKNPLEFYESPDEKALREALEKGAEESNKPDEVRAATDEPKEVKSEKGEVVPADSPSEEPEAKEAKAADVEEAVRLDDEKKEDTAQTPVAAVEDVIQDPGKEADGEAKEEKKGEAK